MTLQEYYEMIPALHAERISQVFDAILEYDPHIKIEFYITAQNCFPLIYHKTYEAFGMASRKGYISLYIASFKLQKTALLCMGETKDITGCIHISDKHPMPDLRPVIDQLLKDTHF